jgi:hypothetical protein
LAADRVHGNRIESGQDQVDCFLLARQVTARQGDAGVHDRQIGPLVQANVHDRVVGRG